MKINSKIIGICSALCFLCAQSLTAQQVEKSETATIYAETITIEDLRTDLNILASDALEGRETGTRGQKMAAAFIKSDFESNGLIAPKGATTTGSYYQTFELFATLPAEGHISINDKTFTANTDFFYSGTSVTMKEMEADLVFVGEGNEEDFLNQSVKGKSVFVLNRDQQKMRAMVHLADSLGVKTIFTPLASSEEEFQNMASRFKGFFGQTQIATTNPALVKTASVGSVYLSPQLAELIMGKSISELQELIDTNKNYKNVKAKAFGFKIKKESKKIETENVLGLMEGTDLKDEVIVISCHYDHIGITNGEVNNGADDDGSGITAILEMSEAFAKAKNDGQGPRRSILFVAFTGEEKGLLGSEYYANNPLIPLENTIVDLNIDMIGRIDEAHATNDNYVYLVGSDKLSTELHELSETVNSNTLNLDLDYTYNDEKHPERIYYRSDHWNFAKNNVPVIFYISGFHADYHKPTDTVDKIEFGALQKRAQLIFYTAWELANGNNKPAVDKKN